MIVWTGFWEALRLNQCLFFSSLSLAAFPVGQRTFLSSDPHTAQEREIYFNVNLKESIKHSCLIHYFKRPLGVFFLVCGTACFQIPAMQRRVITPYPGAPDLSAYEEEDLDLAFSPRPEGELDQTCRYTKQ